jgi:aminoglycoside 6'-N-acetyltransferase
MQARYTFRSVSKSDLPLLRQWRRLPHVARWWGSPTVEPEDEKLLDHNIAMWIVEIGGRPFAFVQDYNPHAWDLHPFSHLPARSRGIDLYIGEADLIGKGHGSALVSQHVRSLFDGGTVAIGADPHPANERARRAFAAAGFKPVTGPVKTRWGDAILMELWSEER